MSNTIVELTREHSYADSQRSYKIILDDNVVGEIYQGETKQIEVSPTSHSICLKIDFAGSRKIQFTITAGQKIKFTCRSNITGLKVLFGIVYLVLFRNNYIALNQENMPNNELSLELN